MTGSVAAGKEGHVTLLQLQDHQLDAFRQPKTSRHQPSTFAWGALQGPPVLAVTGLAAEARLAAGPGVTTIMAGGGPAPVGPPPHAPGRPGCRARIHVRISRGRC